MLFNSYEYIVVFLPVVCLVYFYLKTRRLAEISKGFLAAASLFFYSWWEIRYLPLILISLAANYIIGSSFSRKGLSANAGRKALLAAGLVLNLGLLGYYKYTDFFIANINALTGAQVPLTHLVLPL